MFLMYKIGNLIFFKTWYAINCLVSPEHTEIMSDLVIKTNVILH